MSDREPADADTRSAAPSFWQSVHSVAAAFFGVQNSKNRERDFTHGKPLHFIFIGIAMTAGLIAVIVFIVRMVLRNAGM